MKHLIHKAETIADMKVPSLFTEEEAPDLYEQYEHHVSSDSLVHIFLARRKGRGHIAKGQPCQDYGLNKECRYGMIITAADGLGSCARSDTGSRFACESAVHVISMIADESAHEKAFIHELNRPFTFRRIVSEWMHRIKQDYMEIYGRAPEDLYEAARDYCSTLMLAMISDHYICAANIGDGQVLLFNHDTAYRLRPHEPKSSSVTDCLHDPRSWSEGFQSAVFERSLFNGILLSSDGIYDFLSEGQSFHLYANQLAERFLSCAKPEYPFDYITPDGKVHHLYESGTFDDCTVHMALLLDPFKPDPVQEYIHCRFEKNALERMNSTVRRYHVMKDGRQHVLISSPDIIDFTSKHAHVLSSIHETDVQGIHCAFYDETPFTSLEEMYASSQFSMNRTHDAKKLMRIVQIYESMKRLADELMEKGLILNGSASFLSGLDENGNLILYKEAVSKMKEGREKERYSSFEKYFRSLYGVLVFENRKYPVFRCGLSRASNTVCRFDGLGSEMLGIIRRNGRQYELVSQSDRIWTGQNGTEIRNGEALTLSSGVSFSFQARNDIRLTYHFVRKEDL